MPQNLTLYVKMYPLFSVLRHIKGNTGVLTDTAESEPIREQEGYGPIDFPALVYNWLHLVTCGHNCSQVPYGPNWSHLVTSGQIWYTCCIWSLLVTSGPTCHILSLLVTSGHSGSHLVKTVPSGHIWSLLVTPVTSGHIWSQLSHLVTPVHIWSLL